MYNKSVISNRDWEASNQLITKRVYKTKSVYLTAWKQLYEKVASENEKCLHMENQRLRKIITFWRHYASEKVRINASYAKLKSITDHKRKVEGFSQFYNNILYIKSVNEKNAKADKYYKTITFTKYKEAWMTQVAKNRPTTSKIVQIQKKQKHKILSNYWTVMMKISEERRRKLRFVKIVTRIPFKIEYRNAVIKWIEFVKYSRVIDAKFEEGSKYFKYKRLASAMSKLHEYRQFKQEKRERDKKIELFYFHKQAIQIFDLLKYNVEMQKEKAAKNQTAICFRAKKLMEKGMLSWSQYMSDNYELFIKKRAVIKRLRERRCPKVFEHWKIYAEKRHIYVQKRDKAQNMLNNNLIV
jgi:hypothetical protein